MNLKIKSLAALIATFSLLVGGLSAPANATGRAVNIVFANDSLAGSSVTGFDAGVTLRVALTASRGTLTWPDNANSGAYLVSNGGYTAQGLWLEGSQSQLTAAISEITVNKPCSGNYRIYAQVSDTGFLKNPVSNHLYKYHQTSKPIDEAIADAAATPLVSGGTSTFGYLVTATDDLENVLINMAGSSWLGASDRVTEGDWKWITGPETGMSFYSGRGDQDGATLTGKFASWGNGEPNDSNNEDFAEIYGDGLWNDVSEGDGRNYVIEWGGMPGDDLSSVSIFEDSVDISVQGPFTGNGIQSEPYLVNNATDLRNVADCGEYSAYFKQTANIALPSDWAGDQNFRGHYDGNGKSITYPSNFLVPRSGFGVWSTSGSSNSSVTNLTVSGNIVSTSRDTVGLLFGSGNAKLIDITVRGSISTSQGQSSLGGVAGEYGGNMTRVHSTVNIFSTSDGRYIGGLAGYYMGTMLRSTWDGTMNIGGLGTSSSIGGLVGETDCTTISNSSATGTITVSNSAYSVGGLVGYLCGQISDSMANVDIVANSSSNVGGAIGQSNGDMYRIAAYGDVSGFDRVGGLIGDSNGYELDNAYAHGNVVAVQSGGSLVGSLMGLYVNAAYATGTVTAGTSRGLYGTFSGGETFGVHWVPSQSTVAEPSQLESGEVPYSLADSKDFSYYSNDGWHISASWSDSEIWTMCDRAESGYPFLTSLFTEDPCALSQTLTPTPVVSGTGVEEARLTGAPGAWDSGVHLVFAWLQDGNVIANATELIYIPVADDVGKTITFRVTGTKAGYLTVRKTSVGVLISAKPSSTGNRLEITVGGFIGNSWWIPSGFVKTIKAGVKVHSRATTVTCVGIVAAGGSKSWQKSLGLNRASLACVTAKFYNPKLKTVLTWKIAKRTDKVQRGATLRFNR